MTKGQPGVETAAINRKACSLFTKHRITIVPMLYDRLAYRPEILFIGLNPSFDKSGKSIAKGWRKSKYFGKDISARGVKRIYKLNTKRSKKEHGQIIRAQRLAKKYYGKYFNPLKKFAEEENSLKLWDPEEENENGVKFWEHIDLFFERQTDPDSLKGLEGHAIDDFGAGQLRLTEKLIRATRPHNIIIVNRKASEIFSEYSTFVRWYDVKMKCMKIKIGKAPPCNVFLSRSWSWGVGKKLGPIKKDIQQTLNKYKLI
jgi:hypothetical protein